VPKPRTRKSDRDHRRAVRRHTAVNVVFVVLAVAFVAALGFYVMHANG
jgi:hypothetical protein